MAIVHMANALMRSRRGEIIEPLGEDFLQEIAASGELTYLRRLNDALLAKFSVRLHPNEEGYLLANLFTRPTTALIFHTKYSKMNI